MVLPVPMPRLVPVNQGYLRILEVLVVLQVLGDLSLPVLQLVLRVLLVLKVLVDLQLPMLRRDREDQLVLQALVLH